MNNFSLTIDKEKDLNCTNNKGKKEQYFRIKPSNYKNYYYIESGLFNKYLGVNCKNELVLKEIKEINND